MATDVYFGICPNVPADFKTGSPTITISGGVATFSTAQTDDLMGIGAVIDYDVDNKITYISGKNSTLEWTVINGDGTTPSNVTTVTVNSISHPFTSLSTANSGVSSLMGGTDLVSLNLQLNLVGYCRQDTYNSDYSNVYFSFKSDSTHRIKVYTPYNTSTQCNFNHRVINHGIWDDTKYRIISGATINEGPIIGIREDPLGLSVYLDIEAVQMYWVPSLNINCHLIHIDGCPNSTVNVTKCIGRILAPTQSHIRRTFVYIRAQSGRAITDSVYNIYNNVVTMSTNAGAYYLTPFRFANPGLANLNSYENTFINFYTPAISDNTPNDNIWDVRNNVFLYTSIGPNSYVGLGGLTWNNNIWRETDTGKSGDIQTSQTDAQLFTSATGNVWIWDFLPKEGSDLIDVGDRLADLTPDVSGDIDNSPGLRPWGVGWDVGALENQTPSDNLVLINRRRHTVSSGF